jgi:DNA invertase Pin-like site-specific DNA recombinase
LKSSSPVTGSPGVRLAQAYGILAPERRRRGAGATLHRPALERLRDRAHEGAFEVLLCHAPDRLARRYAYQVLLLEEFARVGVEVIFAKEPERGDTPEDELLRQFQGIISEYERAQIAERTRRGKLYRARAGSQAALSGAPYGYRYVKKTEHTDASTRSTRHRRRSCARAEMSRAAIASRPSTAFHQTLDERTHDPHLRQLLHPQRSNDPPTTERRPLMTMDHKTVLITGANSGVGYAAARELAATGAEIVMVCRDRQRGSAAQQELMKVATGPAPTLLLADLSSQARFAGWPRTGVRALSESTCCSITPAVCLTSVS